MAEELQLDELEPIFEALDDPVPLIRSGALRALVRLPLAEDARARTKARALDLLSEPGHDESNAGRIPTNDLVAAVGLIDDEQVRDRLHAKLSQGAEEDRRIVAHELAKLGDDAAVSQLVDDLSSSDPALRLMAASDLLGLHPGPFLARIQESLRTENDLKVRKTLATVLARAGEVDAISALLTELAGQADESTGDASALYPYFHELIAEIQARGPFPAAVSTTLRERLTELLNPEWYPSLFVSRVFEASERRTAPARPLPTHWKPYERSHPTRVPASVEAALGAEGIEGIKALDSKTVGHLVSTLIHDEIKFPSFAANDAVDLVRIRPDLSIDIPALFTSYRLLKDPNYLEPGMVAPQLAWIVSRVGARRIVSTLTHQVASPDASVRLAAVDLIEAAAIYVSYSEPPYMIGGMGAGGPRATVQEVADELIRRDEASKESRTAISQMEARSEFQPPAAAPSGTSAAPPAAPSAAPPAGPSAAPSAGKSKASRPGLGRRVGSLIERVVGSRRAKPLPEGRADDVRDPPRTAYPRVECDSVVVAQVEFALRVGIDNKQDPQVVGGGPMVRPKDSVGDYVLSVQVVADGFSLRAEESWRVPLAVTYEQPSPSTVLHLTAEPQDASVLARTIQVLYSVNGQTIGAAFRPVAVVIKPELVFETAGEPVEPGVDIAVPTAETACDLTLRISMGKAATTLLFTLESPHEGIALGTKPIEIDMDNSPELLARQLVDKVRVNEGTVGLLSLLGGFGKSIRDKLPGEFWDALRAVRARVPDRPPTILLLSQEPYVPWELAVMDDPLIDSSAPPFLGAQADVGRWVLGPRVKVPPPVAVSAERRAVISGIYEQSGWERLRDAEDEASRIQDTYAAKAVTAKAKEVLACLNGNPEADLIHFAVHGTYDPKGTDDGLVLTDGAILDPMQVKDSHFVTAPFVFLNACQVGSGNRILGDYAGMAAAFLYAGAAGVVAPLWSINDAVARDVALDFYAKTAAGSRPASVFRLERARFKEADTSSTYLAYQFFGHPLMRLLWTRDASGGVQ